VSDLKPVGTLPTHININISPPPFSHPVNMWTRLYRKYSLSTFCYNSNILAKLLWSFCSMHPKKRTSVLSHASLRRRKRPIQISGKRQKPACSYSTAKSNDTYDIFIKRLIHYFLRIFTSPALTYQAQSCRRQYQSPFQKS
jgi:hypothetical protein